jgi:hypothetical protein
MLIAIFKEQSCPFHVVGLLDQPWLHLWLQPSKGKTAAHLVLLEWAASRSSFPHSMD